MPRGDTRVSLWPRYPGAMRPVTCRRSALVGLAALPLAGWIPAMSQERKALLAVFVSGPLPGFAGGAAVKYVAARMSEPDVGRWAFAPGRGKPAAMPGRVEWRFEDVKRSKADPEFAPDPDAPPAMGPRMISAELKLFLNSRYMTAIFDQAAVTGGDKDPVLAAFIVKMTDNLLGLRGAYRAIDRRWAPLR